MPPSPSPAQENPMKGVPAPKFQKVEVEPFTQEEITRVLKVCNHSREAETCIRRKSMMRRPTAKLVLQAIL